MDEQNPIALVKGLKEFVLKQNNTDAVTLLSAREVLEKTKHTPVLICNRALLLGHLGSLPALTLDILELFAFVCPAVECVPLIPELAKVLKMRVPKTPQDQASTLFQMTQVLLSMLSGFTGIEQKNAVALALTMTRNARWGWGIDVLTALGVDIERTGITGLAGFTVWDKIPEWVDMGTDEPVGSQPVSEHQAVDQLVKILASDTTLSEERLEQVSYTKIASKTFNPRQEEGIPESVLLEAGTGVGKTLGYIAPASVWCDLNAGSVWISTYTKNLQKQLDTELTRLFPDPQVKRRCVAIRKGRENYLCLLNYAEAVGRIELNPSHAIPLGLIARWILHTKDGDLNGGDFPSWLIDLFGARGISNLADQRSECIYGQCFHFKKCFIEKNKRLARRAKIIVANHALVMNQLAGGGEDTFAPTRYIFDEGHQIFNAADSVFCAQISCIEGVEMRRWIFGIEDAKVHSRTKGLNRRLEDLAIQDADIKTALDDVIENASFLPRQGVLGRVKNKTPDGVFDSFLVQVYHQVLARKSTNDNTHSLQCEPRPILPEIEPLAMALLGCVKVLESAVLKLIKAIEEYLDKETATLESSDKQRCTALARSLKNILADPLAVWRVMLQQINAQTPNGFVDWFEVAKDQGIEQDIGYYRHWIDPTFPFAHALAQSAHGVLMTSATLKDQSNNTDKDWQNALKRTGLWHFQSPLSITTQSIDSPFDYKNNARVFIITDVDKKSVDQVSCAFRELFIASNGGGLGIFTAVSRLKAVYQRIKNPLADKGLPLLAQHIDAVNMSTLLGLFKAQEDSVLLGTDAVRDGIDVPGRSLRLLVFDRVPWHKPDMAHKARKAVYEGLGEEYNLMLVRMKLSQAFGRLIRKKDDKGVFVLLDRALPSEALSAFPKEIEVEKIGLKDVLTKIKEFL